MGLVAPKNNFFDTVEEALFGSVAQDEIKNLVVSCVSMCFEHDTDGEVQLCRFHDNTTKNNTVQYKTLPHNMIKRNAT